MAEQLTPEGKPQLRKRLLLARTSLRGGVKAELDRTLRDHVTAAIRRRRPAAVAAYAPMASEPLGARTGSQGDFLPDLLAGSMASNGESPVLLLPVWLPGNSLAWRRYVGPEGLTATRQGLLEPALSCPVAQLADAELVIVPALAVDVAGRRLGRGAGCYDRALTEISAARTTTVAVVYDDELLDELPAEPHDVRVNAVITPSGGWRELS